MARMARLVAPGYPHHAIQRGNRRQTTFFNESDYRRYFELLVESKARSGIEILAYCFMPNHVHLVVVPEHDDSLRQFFSESHRQYTRRINSRFNWRGHLWQERFHSFVMSENHLLMAVRYIEQNPVRARLCEAPDQWRWSSVHAHLRRQDDDLVSVSPMLDRIANWTTYLQTEHSTEAEIIRTYTKTGRPSDEESFLNRLELLTGRDLHRKRMGRPPGKK